MGIEKHAVILAAGDRALTDDPIKPNLTHISKMFAPLGQKTVIWWVVNNALEAVEQITLIIKPEREACFRLLLPSRYFGKKIRFAFQPKARGSADALRCAYLDNAIPQAGEILLLMGDQPLFPGKHFRCLLDSLFGQNRLQQTLVTISTMEIPPDDPDFIKCGVVEIDDDRNFKGIVKKSTAPKLWHAGPYVFKGDFLQKSILDLPTDFEGEQHVYLVVQKALSLGPEKVTTFEVDYKDARGVDSIKALQHVRESFAIQSRLR